MPVIFKLADNVFLKAKKLAPILLTLALVQLSLSQTATTIIQESQTTSNVQLCGASSPEPACQNTTLICCPVPIPYFYGAINLEVCVEECPVIALTRMAIPSE